MTDLSGEDDIIDIDEADGEVAEYYDSAESWLERKIADTRDAVREEPIKMLAIAAGVGAVLGAIFLR